MYALIFCLNQMLFDFVHAADCVLFYFQEAVKLKPDFSDAYLNLGNVYKVNSNVFWL